MDSRHLTEVCAAFDLGEPISVEENQEGVLNRNYMALTDRGRYFIKSVRDRRKDSIPIIAAAERFMAEGGVLAVVMLRRATGEDFLICNEEVYTVYPYLSHAAPAEIPYMELGSMLARIHLRGADPLPELLRSVYMREKEVALVDRKLAAYRERAGETNTSVDTLFRTYIEAKIGLLHALPSVPEYPPSLVHGDYHARNILFDVDTNIVGICDWEKAELAPRAYEIARSVQYIAFEGREEPYVYDRDTAIRHGRAFLDGYRQVSDISNEELRDGFFLRLRKLVMTFWLEESFYDRGDARANKFIANETKLIREFTEPETLQALLT